MQALAAEVWRLRPELLNGDCSVGELAWIFGRADHPRRLWRVGDEVRAFAYTVDDSLIWQVHPAHTELIPEVLDALPFSTTCVQSGFDVAGFGLEPEPDAPWDLTNTRELDSLPDPTLPAGFRHVTMSPSDDVAGFVDAHRRAWEGSKLDVPSYRRLMDTWPYRPSLDVAVEGPDGALVATANVWFDAANRIAQLEPVGVDPAFRQLGIGRAMNLFAMHAARDEGAATMIVACRGDDAAPVPRRLYASVGFRPIARDVTYRRT
jgi:ribosomal protein S18 acetylase RimI-like enzyme